MTRPSPSTTHAPTTSTAPRYQRIGFLLALGSAALFSLKGVVVKLGLAQGVGVETLMLWRMGLALPVYLAVGVHSLRQRSPQDRPGLPTFAAAAALGVLSYYVCTWLDFTGMRFISAQLERMVLFTYPILTALLARLLLGERFTRQHVAALVLSYAGVLLVFGAEVRSFGPGAGWGIALVFAAALLFAFYVIYAKPVIGRLGARLFTCVAMAAATVGIALHNVVAITATDQPLASVFSAPAVAAGVVLALVCTVLPSFMLSEAISRIGPSRTSAAGNVGPVVTTVLAVWILHEPFGVAQATGLVLILLGVGMVGRIKKTA
ncbi:MAG: DMT family transporter [Planctomycetota bacterium]